MHPKMTAILLDALLVTLALPALPVAAMPLVDCEPNPESAPANVILNCLSVYALDSAALAVWETDMEIENVGFFVLRADAPGGPFMRVSQFIISLADPTGQTGAHYEYLDGGLTNGQTYYYKLEAINVVNQSQFLPADPVAVTPYPPSGVHVSHMTGRPAISGVTAYALLAIGALLLTALVRAVHDCERGSTRRA